MYGTGMCKGRELAPVASKHYKGNHFKITQNSGPELKAQKRWDMLIGLLRRSFDTTLQQTSTVQKIPFYTEAT